MFVPKKKFIKNPKMDKAGKDFFRRQQFKRKGS